MKKNLVLIPRGAACILGMMLSSALPVARADAPGGPATVEPTRIVIECEDMKGVDQKKFGAGPGWQVGRWGYDLYQNMIFGGVWSSRMRNAMTDASSAKSEATSVIEVPADATYKVWAKYECPPNFNYAFGIRIQNADGNQTVFDKTYGLINAEKHYSFNDAPMRGSLYWSWGIDHDAAEGYEAVLKKGRYRVTLYKTDNPAPAGARSVDAILLTTDLSPISSPKFPRYPMLDELRRANHVYFRFRNTSNQPVKIGWNHWGHRQPDYYFAVYRDLVKFYDASGKLLPPPANNTGDWPDPIPAGGTSVWYDLGPTMNTESSSPFAIKAVQPDVNVSNVSSLPMWGASLPFGVDIALAPNAKNIVKSFDLGQGESELDFMVQPDLYRADGVGSSKKIADIYRDVTRQLNTEPRLGPIPKKLRLFGDTGGAGYVGPGGAGEVGWDFDLNQEFRYALGINTLTLDDPSPKSKDLVDAIVKWNAPRGSLISRSYPTQFASGAPRDVEAMAAKVRAAAIQNNFYYVSFGDEIGLPAVDVNDPAKVEVFRAYVKAQGETPQTLGVANWEQVKPLSALSSEVAVQIGVLPQGTTANDAQTTKLKRLYWYSYLFTVQHGLEDFAAKTRQLKAALGDQAQTTANLGGMHPFYWMSQDSFIDGFKYQAMSLAWSEDYTYCQPEASRLVEDFEASYLRKGASYHDTPMQFYCMPHYPGNTPQHLLQNAVMLWANNVKDLDWFNASPDAWVTENYIAYRGGMPMWKMLRTVSGMAGLVEDDLIPARPVNTPIAMVISRSSDIWEVEGKGQGAVAPGSVATNVSQEERKNLWYALRLAGYRVDLVTEDDINDGLLKNYKVAYLCGQNLDRKAAAGLKSWVGDGGILMATAGAARKDEFDEPLTALDEVLGRGTQNSYDHYRGPLRAKIELLFEKPKDQMQLDTANINVLCSEEKFAALPTAEILGRYKSDNSPALVRNRFGKGVAYYTGTLPGEAFMQHGLPLRPMGKGGDESDMSHFEPVDYDTAARDVILRPVTENHVAPDTITNHRSVVCGRLASAASTVIPIVNLAEQHDGQLKNVEIRISGLPKAPRKVWSTFHKTGIPFKQVGNTWVVTLPTLQSADIIVLSY